MIRMQNNWSLIRVELSTWLKKNPEFSWSSIFPLYTHTTQKFPFACIYLQNWFVNNSLHLIEKVFFAWVITLVSDLEFMVSNSNQVELGVGFTSI